MIFEEYRAKSSLQSGIEPLYSYSYSSVDSNFYRGNWKSPGRKREFSTEERNKTSEEWNKTSEEWNETSEEFFVSSLDISKSPPRNCSISLIVPSMTSSLIMRQPCLSSEVSFHSSELLYPSSVGNVRLLRGAFRFPRDKTNVGTYSAMPYVPTFIR